MRIFFFFALIGILNASAVDLLDLIPIASESSSGPVAGLTDFESSRMKLIREISRADALEKSAPESHLPYVGVGDWRPDFCPHLGWLGLAAIIQISQDACIFLANANKFATSRPDLKRRHDDAEPEQSESQVVVVKYATDFRERLERPSVKQHPLKQEYLMMKIIEDLGVTPKVHYLSPRAVLAPDVNALPPRIKSISISNNMSASVTLKSEARFMVMEFAGVSLHHYTSRLRRSNPDYFFSSAWSQRIIKITRNMLEKMEKIHERGVLHNDIHGGNMVFRSSAVSEQDVELLLLDFGFATFYPDEIGRDLVDPHIELMKFSPRYLSIWQLMGQRAGPRDDIYRLIYTMADMLHRDGYSTAIKKLIPPAATLKDSRTITLKARQEEPLFLPSAVLGTQIDSLEPQVLQKLEDIHTLVKTYTHPDMRVDYTFIRESLDSVIASFA